MEPAYPKLSIIDIPSPHGIDSYQTDHIVFIKRELLGRVIQIGIDCLKERKVEFATEGDCAHAIVYIDNQVENRRGWIKLVEPDHTTIYLNVVVIACISLNRELSRVYTRAGNRLDLAPLDPNQHHYKIQDTFYRFSPSTTLYFSGKYLKGSFIGLEESIAFVFADCVKLTFTFATSYTAGSLPPSPNTPEKFSQAFQMYDSKLVKPRWMKIKEQNLVFYINLSVIQGLSYNHSPSPTLFLQTTHMVYQLGSETLQDLPRHYEELNTAWRAHTEANQTPNPRINPPPHATRQINILRLRTPIQRRRLGQMRRPRTLPQGRRHTQVPTQHAPFPLEQSPPPLPPQDVNKLFWIPQPTLPPAAASNLPPTLPEEEVKSPVNEEKSPPGSDLSEQEL